MFQLLDKWEKEPPKAYTVAVIDLEKGVIEKYYSPTIRTKDNALDIKNQLNGLFEHLHKNKEAIMLEYPAPSLLKAQSEILYFIISFYILIFAKKIQI